MAEANLDGVESLLEDMVNGDPDWAKMNGVPGLLEGWADVREKFTVATEEFKVGAMLHIESVWLCTVLMACEAAGGLGGCQGEVHRGDRGVQGGVMLDHWAGY